MLKQKAFDDNWGLLGRGQLIIGCFIRLNHYNWE